MFNLVTPPQNALGEAPALKTAQRNGAAISKCDYGAAIRHDVRPKCQRYASPGPTLSICILEYHFDLFELSPV